MKKIVIAALIAVLVCGSFIGGYSYLKTPVAYISLDINPSVELGVNALNEVVTAEGYNEDGQTILEGQDVVNTDITDAVNTLVQSADDNGFIADDGSTIISVTSETNDTDLATELQNEAEQGANEAIEESGDTAVVYKDNVALARRDEARELGITPGKLNLIQKLQALDPTITVDQYKDAKVKDIMKKAIELKKASKVKGTEDTEDEAETTTALNGTETTVAAADANVTDISAIEKAVAKSENNQKVKAGTAVTQPAAVPSTIAATKAAAKPTVKATGKKATTAAITATKENITVTAPTTKNNIPSKTKAVTTKAHGNGNK